VELANASDPILVVDFGTSNSAAAIVTAAGTTLLKEPSSTSYSWPSAVFGDGDSLLVGAAAERRKRVDPGRYVSEFKRYLGEPVPVNLGDKGFMPQALVTAVLARFGEEAKRHADEPVDRLVVAVPAAFARDSRAELVIAAGEAAGFALVETVAEPVAAASAALLGRPFGHGDVVLVYDFGGGTFDAALIRFGTGEPPGPAGPGDGSQDIEVLGSASLDHCGGHDIDNLVVDYLRQHLPAGLAGQLAAGEDSSRTLRLRLRLRELARTLKENLSDEQEVVDFLDDLNPDESRFDLDRNTFNALIRPLVDDTIRCCRELCSSTGVSDAQLAGVILVGGTSRIPLVAELVAEHLGPVRHSGDPELAVIQGAAAQVRRAGSKRTLASAAPDGEIPLRWILPTPSATVLRWMIPPGGAFGAGGVVAVVRDQETRIWNLTARRPGVLTAQHVAAGERVISGDWLLTARDTASVALSPRVLDELGWMAVQLSEPERPFPSLGRVLPIVTDLVTRESIRTGISALATALAAFPGGQKLPGACRDLLDAVNSLVVADEVIAVVTHAVAGLVSLVQRNGLQELALDLLDAVEAVLAAVAGRLEEEAVTTRIDKLGQHMISVAESVARLADTTPDDNDERIPPEKSLQDIVDNIYAMASLIRRVTIPSALVTELEAWLPALDEINLKYPSGSPELLAPAAGLRALAEAIRDQPHNPAVFVIESLEDLLDEAIGDFDDLAGALKELAEGIETATGLVVFATFHLNPGLADDLASRKENALTAVRGLSDMEPGDFSDVLSNFDETGDELRSAADVLRNWSPDEEEESR